MTKATPTLQDAKGNPISITSRDVRVTANFDKDVTEQVNDRIQSISINDGTVLVVLTFGADRVLPIVDGVAILTGYVLTPTTPTLFTFALVKGSKVISREEATVEVPTSLSEEGVLDFVYRAVRPLYSLKAGETVAQIKRAPVAAPVVAPAPAEAPAVVFMAISVQVYRNSPTRPVKAYTIRKPVTLAEAEALLPVLAAQHPDHHTRLWLRRYHHPAVMLEAGPAPKRKPTRFNP